MLEALLQQEEGKLLEFKENTQSLNRIVQPIIAFANTAGGTLVIGIKDKTKEAIGADSTDADQRFHSIAIKDSI